MATSRSNPIALVVVAMLTLACTSPEGAPSPAAEQAKIEKLEIEHVTPKRDAVGPQPTMLEWTAVEGADSYAISVENEIEIGIFDQEQIKTTSVPWPKEVKLDPGTYFWRIVAVKGDRVIADSGRAAFVVLERPSASLRPAPSAVEGR
jgi:hypothetical protein